MLSPDTASPRTAAQKIAAITISPPIFKANTIRYAPRTGFAGRMVGGQFQGSSDGVTYTTLYTITTAPVSGRWTNVPTRTDLTRCRFLRYLAPPQSCGDIAELEFDTPGGKLTGTPFGTAGPNQNPGTAFAQVFDGQFGTYFDAPSPGTGDFVGIDRGAPVQVPPAPVQLPIEVMGADGTTQSVQVSVPASAAAVTGLWMQAHNLSYADKASVQVNGGAWLPLDNATVQVSAPGKSYDGIGGGFSTLQMLLPLPAGSVTAGTNRISFRFNHTDGVSSGFRILAFNLMNAAGQPVLPASAFVQDDPSAWQPPMPDAASIAAGQALYGSGQLLQSSVVRSPIHAACADCHTDDGRDLKYFNFSNYSIIQRAQFHGLTQTQGQQIASYIRTLRNADGTPVPSPGRPWNPPYQPGPGLDSQPIQNWAAGAGVNAVLDKDSDMMPYLFPNGITKEAISSEGSLNVRELPVAFQLLDWNGWLPRIHPKDAYGAAFLQDRAFTDYLALRANLTGPSAESYKTAHIGNDQPSAYMTQARLDLGRWSYDSGQFTFPKTQPMSALTPLLSQQLYSEGQWQRVKTWGLMQEFGMENLGKVALGPRADERTWLDPGSFNISPGKSHLPDVIANGGFSQDELQFETLNNQWYYLGLIQNAGNGYRTGTAPIDYPYARNRVINLMQAGGPALPLMELVWTTKGSQQGAGLGLDDNFGWSPVTTDDLTALFYEDPWFTTLVGTRSSDAGWAPGAEIPVVQAATEAWFDKIQSYTPQQFYSAGFADPAYIPSIRDNGPFGDKVMAYLYFANNQGMDQDLINRIAEWGKTVWPLGNWNAFETNSGTVVASAANPGPSGTGSWPNLGTAPAAPYAIEFDVTEKSYVPKDYALVTVTVPGGTGQGYVFGGQTTYSQNDLHVGTELINGAGALSGTQFAFSSGDAASLAGKTIHCRVDVMPGDFVLRCSNPLPAPQTPFTGTYPHRWETKDTTYNVAGASLGVTYIAPAGVTAGTGLHLSNWKVVQFHP